MARLGDICDILNGFAFKSERYVTSGIRIIRIANVQKGYIEDSTPVFYSYDSKEANKYALEDGDILMSLTGNVGRVAKLTKEYLPAALNQRVACLRIKDKVEADKAFLFNLLNSDYFEQQCIDASKGVAQKNMSTEWLKEYEIPLFPIKQQQEISKTLDRVGALIFLRKQQLAKLDELVKARFVELFGDLHSTNFPKCKMRDVCGIKHGYAFSGEFFTEEDNNILLVTPGNFKVGGGFQEKKCKFFTGEYSKEYVLNGGDLIVTMTDLSKNMDTLGYSAIVPCTDRVYLHNQRIGLFVDLSEKINRVFLMYFMQTTEYRDSIIASATGSTVHHTSPSKILDCDVFVPPIELQEQFAAFVEQTDKSKLAIQESLTKLETLKKALMQRFFG